MDRITDGASSVVSTEELAARSRDVKWYEQEMPEVPALAREVFEQYSKIPATEVADHIYRVREKAWDVFPYPCIGGWRFLILNLCNQQKQYYPDILSRVQAGEAFLDLGCCFGQELRRLILDGAPQVNLYGMDLRSQFFDLGYDLFLDRETCEVKFTAADVFTQSPADLGFQGKFSVVYAAAFFHLFDRPQQLEVARFIAAALKPEPGSMVLGRQVGSTVPGRYAHATNESGVMYRHDVHSWKELWDEVGREMGVRWDVKAELKEASTSISGGRRELTGCGVIDKLHSDDVRQLDFCVTKL